MAGFNMFDGKASRLLAGQVSFHTSRAKGQVCCNSLPKWNYLKNGAFFLRELRSVRLPDDWPQVLVTSTKAAGQSLKAIYTLRPEGPGTCDHNAAERVVNLITTAPYFTLGWKTMRERKSSEAKVFGASLMGVGAGAAVFHASCGDLRHWGRKMDYWMIAASTAALLRAVFPNGQSLTTKLSLAVTPVQPLGVSAANIAAMEWEYLQRARQDPKLRRAYGIHALSSAVGATCFFVEDFYPKIPFIHSTWHCLSVVSIATIGALLADSEERAALGTIPRPTLSPRTSYVARRVWRCTPLSVTSSIPLVRNSSQGEDA